MAIISDTRSALRELSSWLSRTPWREQAAIVDAWARDLEKPCVIAVSGLVSAGKSSFINALLKEDLTVVGDLETTATINVIRYAGVQRDDSAAVKCVWKDGRTEWRDKAFLRALQGKNSLTLRTAAAIDHLEFFVDNPLLSQVTVIDTPGYGAYTGKNGDAHEKTLRAWHAQRTRDLTVDADAVIFLLDASMANFTDTDIAFLTGADKKSIFSQDRALFLLSKSDLIDLPSRQKRVESLRSDLGKRVPDLGGSVFLPVSARVQRFLNRHDEASCQRLIGDLRQYLTGPRDIGLLVESRFPMATASLRRFKEDFGWSVVKTVAHIMLETDEAPVAMSRLGEIAGFSRLQRELDRIFFERTSVLRCSRIVNETLKMIHQIQDFECRKYRLHRDMFRQGRERLENLCGELTGKDESASRLLSGMLSAEQIRCKADPDALERELDGQERSLQKLQDDDSELHLLSLMHRIGEVFEANRSRFTEWGPDILGTYGVAFDEVLDVSRNYAVYKQSQQIVDAGSKAQSWSYIKAETGDAALVEFAELASRLYMML